MWRRTSILIILVPLIFLMHVPLLIQKLTGSYYLTYYFCLLKTLWENGIKHYIPIFLGRIQSCNSTHKKSIRKDIAAIAPIHPPRRLQHKINLLQFFLQNRFNLHEYTGETSCSEAKWYNPYLHCMSLQRIICKTNDLAFDLLKEKEVPKYCSINKMYNYK